MTTDNLRDVACLICGTRGGQEILFSAAEVAAHLAYLRRFHGRRLRADVAEEVLVDRVQFTQDYVTDIVSCTGCGLLFRSPRPSNAAITRAYRRDHYGEDKMEEAFQAQRAYYRDKARALARWLSGAQPRVVEVGSWVGDFLAAGLERGWDMLGVDPGKEVGAFCRARGFPVHSGQLAEAPLDAGSVDAVTIWNTFDQLPDPRPTLAAAQRLLRPGGVLVVRVPNGACVRWLARWHHRLPPRLSDALHAAMAWNNLLAFPYLYGYSVTTLDRLLRDYGLARGAVQPHVLPRLAGAADRVWAAVEEQAFKLLIQAASRLPQPGMEQPLAPWIDAYYRKPR